jgi:hypothetical protein
LLFFDFGFSSSDSSVFFAFLLGLDSSDSSFLDAFFYGFSSSDSSDSSFFGGSTNNYSNILSIFF